VSALGDTVTRVSALGKHSGVFVLGHTVSGVSALGHTAASVLGHTDSRVSVLGNTAECPHWDTQQIVCSGTHSYQGVRTWTHGIVRTVSRVSVLDTKLAKCPYWETDGKASVLGHTAECPHWDTHLAVSAFEHKGPKLYTAGCDIILTHSLRSLKEQYGVMVRLRHSTPYKGVPMSSDIFYSLPKQ